MKQMISACFLVLVIFQFQSIRAYIATGFIDSKDGQCVAPDGSLFAPSDKWYDREACTAYICTEDADGDFTVKIYGCNTRGDNQHCTEVGGGPGYYPRCCPRKVICNN